MPGAGGGFSGLDHFMAVISGQESGGSYTVANSRTGAHGKYQIMPANWAPWSREAGLPPGAPKTAANQERVARFKMQQYYNQFGSWEAVAVAWYGGPGAAAEWVRNPNAARFNKRPRPNEPSINEYVASIRRKAGSVGPITGGPGAMGGVGGAFSGTSFAAYDSYIRQQAKQLFPTLAKFIDDGGDIVQYVEPYRQTAAQYLEIPVDSIDFMEPKWRKLIDTVAPDGQRRALALWESINLIRTDPVYGYDRTTGARTEAAQLATAISKQFGRV